MTQTVAQRLKALADAAALITARQDLADLKRPEQLTTAAGRALEAVQAERRAVERAARAEQLRATPDLLTAEYEAANR